MLRMRQGFGSHLLLEQCECLRLGLCEKLALSFRELVRSGIRHKMIKLRQSAAGTDLVSKMLIN